MTGLYLSYMGLLSDKPKQMCTSGNQLDESGKQIGSPCGETLIAIPYKRRPQDAKTLNALICPQCDAWDKTPKGMMDKTP